MSDFFWIVNLAGPVILAWFLYLYENYLCIILENNNVSVVYIASLDCLSIFFDVECTCKIYHFGYIIAWATLLHQYLKTKILHYHLMIDFVGKNTFRKIQTKYNDKTRIGKCF